MKLSILLVTGILMLFCLVLPAHAANPDHVTKLLERRSCIGCDLQGADLKNADLRGVNLTRANLRNADLNGADMMAVILKDADLRGADLSDANALVVDLTGANLKGANVTHISPNALKLCHTVSPEGKMLDWNCD